MKYIYICTALLIISTLIGCYDRSSELLYKDIRFVVVSKGGGIEDAGKFGNIPYKSFLIRGVDDSTLYTELNQYHDCYLLTDSVYYNHKIGDILYFKYIRKSRFWHKINNHE
jgi:hypothetical protein